MTSHREQSVLPPNKILLHACCGPCSLEPTRVLLEEGWAPTLFYSNPNIFPAEEYDHRVATLRTWAAESADAELPVEEGAYDPEAWERAVGTIGDALKAKYGVVVDPVLKDQPEEALEMRQARCRACYRLRFERAARFAAERGFEVVSTTLSVSPYQYTEVIREELERACATEGLRAHFVDWRPYYPQATARSKAAGMYRQNYCGCRFSLEEAEEERALRKQARQRAKEARMAARAEADAQDAEQREQARRERQAYADERARRHAILKRMRTSHENR